MYSTLINKFRNIEHSLLTDGEFIDKFDALSLSTVLIDNNDIDTTIDMSIHNLRAPQMNGLKKLVNSLNLLLNESYINQQSTLLSLKKETQNCESFLINNSTYLNNNFDDYDDDDENNNNNNNNNIESQSSLSWDKIPKSVDDDEECIIKNDIIRKEIIFNQLQVRLQEIHDNCMSLLDAKLCAYEVINNTMKCYILFLSSLANDNNISNAKKRATFIVNPYSVELNSNRFLDTSDVNEVLDIIRQLWASSFYKKKIQLATHSLIQNNSIKKTNILTSDKFLYSKIGIGISLILWSLSECFNNEIKGSEVWNDPTFAIFMCFGDIILLVWMWGISIYVWRSCGIDYMRILNLKGTEFEAHKNPEKLVFSSAINLSVVFLSLFVFFNKVRIRGIAGMHASLAAAHLLPVSMVVYFIYKFIMPLDTRKRWKLMLYQVLAAPMYKVSFRDGYIGDILTSLVRVFIPMCFSFAYLLMSILAWFSNDIKSASSVSKLWWSENWVFKHLIIPFITLFPLWIRLMQCLRRSIESGQRFPHMANALKYTSAITVISFGTFQPELRNQIWWIFCFIIATLYQFIWDLTMDWGIIVKSTSKEASSITFGGLALRETRLLGTAWIYIFVMCINLILRFAWTTTLLQYNDNLNNSYLQNILFRMISPLIAAGEILRRMVWGFFRLEHEQLETIGLPELRSKNISDLSFSSFEKVIIIYVINYMHYYYFEIIISNV
jgi:hypothetical protein